MFGLSKFRMNDFERLRGVVRACGLKTRAQYLKWRETGPAGCRWPYHPERSYKDCGWTTWGDFFGLKKKEPRYSKSTMNAHPSEMTWGEYKFLVSRITKLSKYSEKEIRRSFLLNEPLESQDNRNLLFITNREFNRSQSSGTHGARPVFLTGKWFDIARQCFIAPRHVYTYMLSNEANLDWEKDTTTVETPKPRQKTIDTTKIPTNDVHVSALTGMFISLMTGKPAVNPDDPNDQIEYELPDGKTLDPFELLTAAYKAIASDRDTLRSMGYVIDQTELNEFRCDMTRLLDRLVKLTAKRVVTEPSQPARVVKVGIAGGAAK